MSNTTTTELVQVNDPFVMDIVTTGHNEVAVSDQPLIQFGSMNLYLVERGDDDDAVYDAVESIVVAAANELDARRISTNARGDQSDGVWFRPETTVTLIGSSLETAPKIIHTAFNAG